MACTMRAMQILAFAASNSSRSINRRLIDYAAALLHDGLIGDDVAVDIIDINDYEMPIYSIDRQDADGIPEPAHRFLRAIADADALIISFAEHNGQYTAAYKNLYDWVSRIDRKVYQGKPVVMLSTSPGGGGGARVLEHAVSVAERQGSDVTAALSIPRFNDSFDSTAARLVDSGIDEAFRQALSTLSTVRDSAAR